MIPFSFRPFDKEDFVGSTKAEQVRRLAIRGAGVTVLFSAITTGLQIVSTVSLARIITPRDFGLVAMVTTFSLFLMSFGLNGFEHVVIQRDELNRYQASNLFWINCTAGLIFATALALAGAPLARFYRNPLVASVAIGISPAVFFAATSVIHVALLKRAMRFGAASSILIASRAANTIVAIVLGLRGWGYQALVAGIIADGLTTCILGFCLCRWVPNLPRRGIGTGAMVWFAAKVYGRFSLAYFTRNSDYLLVGWRFNALALGFYKKAYDLFALSANQLTAPLHNVALAALSKMQHDTARFKRYLASSLGVIAFIGMAVGTDLTLIGKDLVRLVLGPRWAESGRIFTLFGPGIGIMLLYSTVGWIHLSIGMPGRWFRWTLIETAATATLFVMALGWGPAGIAVAWSLSYWILVIPAFWYAGRPIGFGIASFMAAIWKYIAASLSAGLASAFIIQRFPALAVATSPVGALELIIIKSILLLLLYLFAVILLHQGYEPLLRVAGLLREMLSRTGAASNKLTGAEVSTVACESRSVSEPADAD